MGSTVNLKAKTKHRRCLLVVLAALETNTVIGKVTAGGEGNLSPISNISNNSGRSSDRSSGIWNETYCSSLSEDYDYVRFMNYQDSSGDTVNIINACKEFVEVADPAMLGSDRSRDVLYRLKRTSKIPPALSEYVAPSVELLLHSVLFFWEPRFHPMIRKANMDKLLNVVDGLTASAKCLEPVVPIIGDFSLHLQPYAQALVENKLKESKYYIAKEQISVHEEFDEFLASGELDDYMDQFMSSKDDFMEELVVNKLLPSQFLVLDCFLIKLSFERRAEIVHMHTEICTYDKCLRGLFASEPLKVKAQSLISELEAEGFFDVNSNRINWGKTSFSERVDKFSSEFFPRNSLPKHYAIRGLVIDCRTILLQKDISQQEALEKVVVDVCNSLTGYLRKFWKDTRYCEHQYYHIIRDPLRIRQVNSGPRTQPF
ncbi:uncharacterized protein LOC133903090 isoform X2 [Phragmites australis]|nr:uncharacterized protein LOC133903090 isoform X2 [Phragmites australis]XP_062200433.1 uncharacterized protein LOC133903090 isoform X2 [Phragmites australis]